MRTKSGADSFGTRIGERRRSVRYRTKLASGFEKFSETTFAATSKGDCFEGVRTMGCGRRWRLQHGTSVKHAPDTFGTHDLALRVPARSGIPGAQTALGMLELQSFLALSENLSCGRPTTSRTFHATSERSPRMLRAGEIPRLFRVRTLFQLRSAFNPFLAGDAMRSPRNSFQPLQINVFSANETLAERAVFDSSQCFLYSGQ
jgi:hypothetical protein